MSTEASTSRLLGQVKWFNNKAGYGFITVNEGDQVGKDIFIHYSTIRATSDSQYKYLVQGEYVEFLLEKSSSETHEFQANDVTGVRQGKLMCEMRTMSRPPMEETRAPREEGDFSRVERRRPKPRGKPKTVSA